MNTATAKPEIIGFKGKPLGNTGCHTYDEVPKEASTRVLKFKSGSPDLISGICSIHLGKPPSTIVRDNGVLIPIYNDSPLYVTPQEESLFRRYNVDKYRNKQVLGTDHLIVYPDSKILDGMVTIDKQSIEDMHTAEEVVNLQLTNSKRMGITSYSKSLGINYISMIAEISIVWGFEVLDFGSYITVRSPGEYGCRIKSWMKRSVEKCFDDEIPVSHISGIWTKYDKSTVYNMARAAYTKVIKSNPYMVSFMRDLKVLSDNTLSVPLFSAEDKKVFLSSISVMNTEEVDYNGSYHGTSGFLDVSNEDFKVDFMDKGVKFGDKWVIQIEDTNNKKDYDEFKRLFLDAWSRGEFTSRWGHMYYIRTGLISSSYITNHMRFSTAKDAIIWLS